MRELPNQCYGGSCFVVEHPRELERLDPSLSALVTPTLRALFTDYPGSLRALASRATFAPLARWLEEMSGLGCELGIHLTDEMHTDAGMPPTAFLHLGPAERNYRPYGITGKIPRVPSWCPAPLGEVLRLVGVIEFGYGGAERLQHPSEQQPLDDVVAPLRRSAPESFRGIRLPRGAHEYRTFYRNLSGGWVAANPDGRTYHSGYDPGPAVEDWFTGFFERRLRGEIGLPPENWRASSGAQHPVVP